MEERNFRRIAQDGDFVLYASDVPYRTYRTNEGYIRNLNTGENCGTEVTLYKHYYHGNLPLDEPEYDDCCYEVIREGKESIKLADFYR